MLYTKVCHLSGMMAKITTQLIHSAIPGSLSIVPSGHSILKRIYCTIPIVTIAVRCRFLFFEIVL